MTGIVTFLNDKSHCCRAGDIIQCCLLGEKNYKFTMTLLTGDPIFPNVALGPAALGYWLQLTSKYCLINCQDLCSRDNLNYGVSGNVFYWIPLLSSENSSNLLCVEFTKRNSVAHPPMENLERIDWKFVRQPIRNALVED